MLYVIGLGLDIKDISLKALGIIKKCKNVYLESYTTEFPYNIKELEKIIKKKVIKADRDAIENNAEVIIEKSKNNDVAILIYGDPLSATTHTDLILRVKKANLKIQILHNSSIITAVADTGLQLYKFGKIASIPKWQINYKPESFYDIFKENQAIKAHTLFLIDIGLKVGEALGYIKDIAKQRQDDLTSKLIVVCSRLGTEKPTIIKGEIEELIKKKFPKPACIIIPSALHFMEAEMLEEAAT